MDKALIELLTDQVALVNKIDTGFRTSAYTSICKEMSARFNIDMRTPHIKSRMRTLKPIYMEAKKLLGTSDLGRVMEMFEEMQIVLGNDRPTGDKAVAGFESMTECNVDGAEKNDPKINDDATTSLTIDEFICEDGTQSVSNNNRRVASSSSKKKKRAHGSKSKSNQDFIDAIDRMNITMSKIALALIVETKMDFLNCLWREVMDLEGYDIRVRNTVFGYLSEHEKEAKIFLVRDKPFWA
uniref:Myb/SANT-like domain-containing protein n=1 Tax=Nelumbo nucifera TaxID=4432 RepID=A0A822XVH0_NELNU|nr:TPA_asm: hypothetical protein HUJ06_024552 [Nelumbo nucifera]